MALLLGSTCLPTSASAQDNRPADTRPSLELTVSGHSLTVSGGIPRAPCILLFGVREGYTVLPGAVLRVNALAMLSDGLFDENGNYTWTVHPTDDPFEPFRFLVQAVTLSADMTRFSASNVLQLEYDGYSPFVLIITLTRAAPWDGPRLRATRRLAVA